MVLLAIDQKKKKEKKAAVKLSYSVASMVLTLIYLEYLASTDTFLVLQGKKNLLVFADVRSALQISIDCCYSPNKPEQKSQEKNMLLLCWKRKEINVLPDV